MYYQKVKVYRGEEVAHLMFNHDVVLPPALKYARSVFILLRAERVLPVPGNAHSVLIPIEEAAIRRDF
jgi:hypothetical protein